MDLMKKPGEHKPLSETFWFRASLLFPLAAGVGLASVIYWFERPLAWCGTSKCVQDFFIMFKFPIAIAGFCLPLIAMVAALHRSREAHIQISLSSKQLSEAQANNRFGNYLKHRESLDKAISGYCASRKGQGESETIVWTHVLYARLFPEASVANVNWVGQSCPKYMEKLEAAAKKVYNFYTVEIEEANLYEFLNATADLAFLLKLSYSPQRRALLKKTPSAKGRGLVLPRYKRDINAFYNYARDATAIFTIVRSYAGKNDVDGYHVDWSFTKFEERVKNISDFIEVKVALPARSVD